jgi:hypothetical protein
MIDKFLYKIFNTIDDMFSWLETYLLNLLLGYGTQELSY